MKAIALLILILTPFSLLADQTAINNINTAKRIFWRDLYPAGGNTLYCGLPFAGHSGLDVEHVYAASWMGAHLNCGNRKSCRGHPTHKTRFNHMEADLHNLYPAMAGLNRTRSNKLFGIIDGEARSLLICDFESDKQVTEPRPGARGDIAHAFFFHESRNMDYRLTPIC